MLWQWSEWKGGKDGCNLRKQDFKKKFYFLTGRWIRSWQPYVLTRRETTSLSRTSGLLRFKLKVKHLEQDTNLLERTVSKTIWTCHHSWTFIAKNVGWGRYRYFVSVNVYRSTFCLWCLRLCATKKPPQIISFRPSCSQGAVFHTQDSRFTHSGHKNLVYMYLPKIKVSTSEIAKLNK